jgi:hypothetical protein
LAFVGYDTVTTDDCWSATIRDLCVRTDLGTFASTYEMTVPARGTALLHVVGLDPTLVTAYLHDRTRQANRNPHPGL